MSKPREEPLNRRVLVIDDNEAIHADFRKVLTPPVAASADLLAAEAALFGASAPPVDRVAFELVTASQGEQGLQCVRAAAAAGAPFAVAFVDMRMPPGWDGIETIERIWREFPELEIVICTAFSDYSWAETLQRLGRTDRLLIVKKPFDHVEVLQAASALTHKWNLERQAQRTMDDLAGVVQQRTAELMVTHDRLLAVNRELSAARDAAEAANRSKTLFLANVSHELRTPMTAIIGYAEILQDRMACHSSSTLECEALETIRRNAAHMVCIVGDLLDMAKLEAGKLAVEVQPCEPLRVAEEVVELLRPKAQAKGITLDLVVSTPVPVTIASDPLRLRQILVNLVDNAIKFTGQGGVQLAVEGPAAGEPKLHFAVVDSGVGMPPDVLQRLFRPFEQADVSTTRRFGGTGLGLAISRHLAQLLGGDIAAASSPGGGSTFRLAVATGPLDGVPLQVRRDERAPVLAPAPTPAATPMSARVLLVEDGPDNQRLIQHILQRAGCSVAIAGNGQEGLELMSAGPAAFDIVLMDMQMPVMDGVTATRELRQRGVHTPIVALTANAMAADEQACMQAGCDAFLTKPIDRKKLLATIGSLVAARA